MLHRLSVIAVLMLSLLVSPFVVVADKEASEPAATSEKAPSEGEMPGSLDECEGSRDSFFGEGTEPLLAGCSLTLDDKGVGATCSCSASGAGATCVRNNNQGGNTVTITCKDAAGTVTCSYSKNGTSCSCK